MNFKFKLTQLRPLGPGITGIMMMNSPDSPKLDEVRLGPADSDSESDRARPGPAFGVGPGGRTVTRTPAARERRRRNRG